LSRSFTRTTEGTVALFGGPAGAGKTTLARAWCATRASAAHIELDAVRELIVGVADPQQAGTLQEEQYGVSVEGVCALAGAFTANGYDVAVDDVLEPAAFERYWRPRLESLRWRVVIILPSLAETLARSAGRDKRVLEQHTRTQHAACSGWPHDRQVDTTGLTVEQSLGLVAERLAG
jgi:chloramphenicol 3-O-phosphotransferase